MTHHLGDEQHDPVGYESGNSRNRNSTKKLYGEFGEVELETPRDRNGSFDSKIVAKHQMRFTGFDEKIASMYSRGMTTRDIEAHVKDMYGVDVSAALVSQVTEAVQEDVAPGRAVRWTRCIRLSTSTRYRQPHTPPYQRDSIPGLCSAFNLLRYTTSQGARNIRTSALAFLDRNRVTKPHGQT